jgi:hypothetical protein
VNFVVKEDCVELLNAAIKVENLGKRYQIGKQLKKNLNFQDAAPIILIKTETYKLMSVPKAAI